MVEISPINQIPERYSQPTNKSSSYLKKTVQFVKTIKDVSICSNYIGTL